MSNNNDVNIHTKKKHLTIVIIAIIATSMIIPYQIFAQNQNQASTQATEPVNAAPVSSPALAPLTNVFCIPTAGAVLIESNYIVSFTTATAGAIKFIDITWPAGFNVAGAMLVERTETGPVIGPGTLSIVGQTTTYKVTGVPPPIPAGTPISIMISNIVNPAALSNTCTVTTKDATPATIDGPTASAIFSLKKVGTAQLVTGAVTSDKIADGSITGADMASGVALTGSVSIDSPTLALDSINHRVGIGTTGPTSKLAIRGGGITIDGTLQTGVWNSRIPLANSLLTVDDPANAVGFYTSITIGTDGLPVISYYDSTAAALKVTHCGNALCNAGNTITTVDDPANSVGSDTSITIGTDGLPVISYRDFTAAALKVTHCGNVLCNAGNTITTVDDPANGVGLYTSITIGTDVLPVISYLDDTAGALKVAKCGSIICKSFWIRR